jgi:hypothetical protein
MKQVIALSFLFPFSLAAADQKPPEVSKEHANFFNQKILPLMKQRCYECHSHEANKIKGGLTVDTREGLLNGGDSGPAIVPLDLDKSLFITSVRWDDADFQMPPKKKLPDAEVKLFEEWVKMGAPDPRTGAAGAGSPTTIAAKALEHWAFKPVKSPALPEVKDKAWVKNPVDAFLLAKMEAKGPKPSPPADKSTLLRRASYDIIGLPPSAEETQRFLADKSPDAYAKLVDRLLASPQYGERWARHWLDVARYADTTGDAGVGGKDNRYIYGWTYRDYVIRALNEDKPFDRFITEQLAADFLVNKKQADTKTLAALGFITIGKRFTNPDDEIDDRIDATGRAFMGLTVSCARCHDHKFDPIPQEDYYAWHGIFTSTRESETPPLLAEPAKTPEYADFEKKIAEAQDKVDQLEDESWENHYDEHFAQFGTYLLAIHDAKKGMGGLSVNSFYRSRGLTQGIAQRWDAYFKGAAARGKAAAVKTKQAPAFDPIFAPWMALEAISDEEFAAKSPEVLAKFAPGGESAAKLNPLVAKMFTGDAPKTLKDVADRYGSLFADIQKQHKEKRAELLKAAGKWQRTTVKLDDANAEAVHLLIQGADAPASRTALNFRGEVGVAVSGQLFRLAAKVNDVRLEHPGSPARAMAVEDIPKPRNSHVFIRGDRNKQGPEVPHRFLTQLGATKPFTEGSGRLELAQAIASRDNPLTARVIANRVWLEHFGRGLVVTPSDFGLRGEPPSHPELLDWLARYLMDNGWSLKKLHRVILLSAAYQQRSDDNPKYRDIDPTNILVWKMNRRRLDVEAMRDSILAAAGTLDTRLGGTPIEILGDVPRRTIYSRINRENVPGFLANFDFALPELSSPQRFDSIVPTQALFLMNSPFVIDQAQKLAAQPSLAKLTDEQRIQQIYRRVYQRAAAPQDLADGLAFIREQTDYKPEPPPKTDWQYGMAVQGADKLWRFTETKRWQNREWQSFDKKALVKVTETGGLTGNTAASVRRWVAPADGFLDIEGSIAATTKNSSAGVRARAELQRKGQPPQELGAWKAAKAAVATNLAHIEVRKGDTIDFAVLPGSGAQENYTWAPFLRIADAEGNHPAKHDWNAQSEFAGPPPAPPKGMTPWEKYAQVLLLTNEFVYVN